MILKSIIEFEDVVFTRAKPCKDSAKNRVCHCISKKGHLPWIGRWPLVICDQTYLVLSSDLPLLVRELPGRPIWSLMDVSALIFSIR